MHSTKLGGTSSAVGLSNGFLGSPGKKGMLKSASAPALKREKNLGTLDHNNFTALKSPSKNERTTPMIKKTSSRPKVRPFDGEIKEVHHGPPNGAIYDFEEDGDDGERPYNVLEISLEELKLQPDFLKLDQSKLPLEIFDSLEYVDIDKTPQEWLEGDR